MRKLRTGMGMGGRIILYYVCTEVDKHKQRGRGGNKALVCLIKAVCGHGAGSTALTVRVQEFSKH